MLSLEYLAGFIDGEGSLSLARRRHLGRSDEYSIRVSIYNSQQSVLEEIHRQFGGIPSAVGSRKPRWKPSFALIWTNAAAAGLLRQVAPFLRVKSEHASILLKFHEHVQDGHRARDCQGRLLALTTHELEFRAKIFVRLRELNARGSRKESTRLARKVRRPSLAPVSAKYLAGFIDGEGSLMIPKWTDSASGRTHYRARIAVASSDRVVLEEIRRTFGGILVSQSFPGTKWKASFQLVWSDGMVDTVLSSVAPHLRIKGKQASVLSEFMEHRRTTRQRRHGRYLAPHPAEVVAYRARLHREMRRLNSRGVHPRESRPPPSWQT